MKFRHTATALAQYQSLPLNEKIQMSLMRIRQWYEAHDGNVYVSISGGKDSSVLLDLVRTAYPGVLAVFCDTGLELPEVRQFALATPNLQTIKPTLHFKETVEKYGIPVVSKEVSEAVYDLRTTKSEKVRERRLHHPRWRLPFRWRFLLDAPFKISAKCCQVMKHRPFRKFERQTGLKPFVGTMASESMQRTVRWMRFGCNAFEASRQISCPLSFWTEQDVFQYIVDHSLPYAPIYGDIVKDADGKWCTTGWKRTGCMFCMIGAHLDPERFQRLADHHPAQWKYCMDKAGLRSMCEFLNVPTGCIACEGEPKELEQAS